MMTDHIDAFSLPFAELKNEQNVYDNDSDINLDNIDNFSSMSFLSISMNDSIILDKPNNEFLHLTTMVRSAYFSYLHKCLLNNYLTCHEEGSCGIPNVEVKKCADQLELYAVRLALEVNLYRENMLKMIADIKSDTIKKKAYKKLVIFLEAPKNRIDIAVQTEDTCTDLCKTDNVQNTYTTSNYQRESALPAVNSTNFCENVKDFDDDTNMQIIQEKESDDAISDDQKTEDQIDSQMMDDIRDMDENSQDSLLQHMEDMFCESDDSSDLTKLIEKHSGVTKANIDKEINKICLEADFTGTDLCGMSQNNNISKSTEMKRNTSQGKINFSHYKEMQNRKTNLKGNESIESKQKQKSNAIWFVDRVHYVTKLKSIMIELSLTNYRKHGRIKEKFLKLFGESEEEMMPDSPICIEDHLPACKQRISHWAVQCLMPYYKKRRIKNRELFKDVARYITDMLIIEDTFPEQEYVIQYIERYFRNKKCIKTKQDIYI